MEITNEALKNAINQGEEKKCNTEIFKSVYNNNSMQPHLKYSKKQSKVFYLNEKIYNVRNLKLLMKVKFNYADRVDGLIRKEDIDFCRKIHKDMNSKTGVSQKTYMKANYDLGRYYYNGTLGLQSIKGSIRKLLVDGNAFELDLVNSHIHILLDIIKDYSIDDVDTIKEYSADRDNILSNIAITYKCEKWVAKQLFLILSYGGTFKTWIKHNSLSKQLQPSKFIKDFQNNIRNVIDVLVKDCKYYIDIVGMMTSITKFEKSKKNYYSALALMLQDIETNIMFEVMRFLDKNEIKTETFIHDGITININNFGIVDNPFIEEIEKHILNNLGFNIKLKKKALQPEPEDLKWINDIEKLVDGDNYCIIDNDKDAANYLLDNHLENQVYRNKEVFYIKTENKWDIISKKENVLSALSRIVYQYDIRFETPDGKLKHYSTLSSGNKNICSALYSLIPQNKFISKYFTDTTKYKLCFNDGVYDFKTKTFKEWFECEDVYTTKIIDYDYPTNVSILDIELINNRIWKNMIKDDEDIGFIKKSFARSIAGMVQDKRWFVLMGQRDSGKSKLIKLFGNAFGEYIGTTNSGNLLYDKNNADDAKKNMWLTPIWDCRIVFTSEFETNDVIVNGNKIKSVCSGGNDVIEMRANFQDPQKNIPQFTLVCALNDLPKVEPQDTKEKMVYAELPYQFVSKTTYEESDSKDYYRIGDDSIDEFIVNDTIINAFILDIINNYDDDKPTFTPNIIQSSQSQRDEDNPIDFIHELYDITGNLEDFVYVKDFMFNMKDTKLTSSKLTTLMNKVNRNVIKKKDETEKKVKIFGVKIKSSFNGIDIDEYDEY